MEYIGKYKIEGVIGTGGMGQVLRGLDPFGRQVAIKEILPEFVNNSVYRKRIDREIKVMKSLNDPNVVKIFDSFESDGRLYIVMELIDGVTIEQYVGKNGPFPLKQAVKLMHKLLGTMQYVHDHDIVHRDIKPGNVMVRPNGEVCVLDFGIAKSFGNDSDGDDPTTVGVVLGTDGYMSPEQANGCAIDRRTDIYALGCVMFYLLTGRHAYMTYANDGGRTAAEICSKPFPRIDDFRPGLPPGVQQVLDMATDKNMLRRYQSCRDFSDDITGKCENVPETQDDSPQPGMKPGNHVISVGRENCTIATPPSIKNISRHHCDIEVIPGEDGDICRIFNRSKNGTNVNGHNLSVGEYRDVRPGDRPRVILSAGPPYMLDWNLVLRAIYGDVALPEPEGQTEMTFLGAVKSCLGKYFSLRGRAGRAEFWYFMLFCVLVNTLLWGAAMLTQYSGQGSPTFLIILSGFFGAAMIAPIVAVAARRLHDTGRSSAYLAWVLLPVIGAIILIVYWLAPSSPLPNRYGPPQ